MDILPTVLDAVGIEYPETYHGRRIEPADGKSMIPILQGLKRQDHDILFWKWSHGCAVRQGKWKLVRIDKDPWELYDMESDPVELTNLARNFPAKTAELEALWTKWFQTSSVD
jgi:arylsulfatase